MIIDTLENLAKYNIVSREIVDFLLGLSSKSDVGHYEINDFAYANVDEYFTKPVENCKFEAHKKYIDIQMLLEGSEELDCISVEGLNVNEDYDFKRDVMFFDNPAQIPDAIQLVPFKFALIYPNEAHRPQMGNGQKVKKVVVKIAVK